MRAAHGLFRLMRRKGDEAGAARFALAAQRLYEPDAAGGPDLLLDLARYWTDHAEPSRAQAALRRLGRRVPGLPPAGELAALALTARACAQRGHPLKGSAARAPWPMLMDREIAEEVRFAAALDLAHAARLSGDLSAFTRAKREVLRLAPQAAFPAVASAMANMWPEGGTPSMELAS